MKVGEDAAAFDSSKQSTAKWTFFTVELAVVLAILYAVSSATLQAFAWIKEPYKVPSGHTFYL